MTAISQSLGIMIRETRKARQWSQQHLTDEISSSQSAIHRVEMGQQNVSLSMIERLASALEMPLMLAATEGTVNFEITGPAELAGEIEVHSSKSAAVAPLCASMLNRGCTVLRRIANIEEVDRVCDVLQSVGVTVTPADRGQDLELTRPEKLTPETIDQRAARRTRSILVFLGPLMHGFDSFELPYAGGCDLGARAVHPHTSALKRLSLSAEAHDSQYHATVQRGGAPEHHITLVERGDTVAESVIMAAAHTPGLTVIHNTSGNYIVQDLYFFLCELGVGVDGIGTTTLRIQGIKEINKSVEYHISEDPIEAIGLVTAGIVTHSELTVKRCPVEFLGMEFAALEKVGQRMALSNEYPSGNGHTRLVDVTVKPLELTAPLDKIHPMPFPGLNIDSLPFFTLICATAEGQSIIYNWVYDNRAVHLKELCSLGANVTVMDAHKLMIIGPIRWRGRDIECPPALRPSVYLFLAALAARGTTILRDVCVISRDYGDLPRCFSQLDAQISTFWGGASN